MPKVIRMPQNLGGARRRFIEEVFSHYRAAGRPTLDAISGRIKARPERTEQLVECRHAPAEIGGRPQAEPTSERHQNPTAGSRQPSMALWVALVMEHCASGDCLFE